MTHTYSHARSTYNTNTVSICGCRTEPALKHCSSPLAAEALLLHPSRPTHEHSPFHPPLSRHYLRCVEFPHASNRPATLRLPCTRGLLHATESAFFTRLIRRAGLPGTAAAIEPPRFCGSANGNPEVEPEAESAGEPGVFGVVALRAIIADNDGPDLEPGLPNETFESNTAGGRPFVIESFDPTARADGIGDSGFGRFW